MYDICPPAVYAHESVMAHARYRERVERVVAALREPRDIITYTDDDLADMVHQHGLLANRRPMGTIADVQDPILLFNTFRFESAEDEAARRQRLTNAGLDHYTNGMLGTGAFVWFDSNLETDKHRHDKVCRPCWRIHLQEGCLHKCSYCGFGGLLAVMVNVDEYCTHLGSIIERHPWQTTYLLDDDADPPGLEPELGTLPELIEYFGTLEDRYLIVHTKSYNTDWLRGLRHNGKTIFVWSISGPTQSRIIEPGTGTTEARIAAARVAQEAGYPIRYKFKPIIPVKGWREDAAQTIELLFRETNPDVISLCVYMWNDFDQMAERLPLDLLEPAFVDAAATRQVTLAETRTAPFPPAVRQEIYEHHLREIRRHNATIPVSLSTESFAMWGEMKGQLGCTATNYVCGCGPQSNPNCTTLACHPFQVATRNDANTIPGVT